MSERLDKTMKDVVCPIPSDELLVCAVKRLLDTEAFACLDRDRVQSVAAGLARLLPRNYLPDVYLDLPLMDDGFQGLSFVLDASDRNYVLNTAGAHCFRQLGIPSLDGPEDGDALCVVRLKDAGAVPECEIHRERDTMPDWLKAASVSGGKLREDLPRRMCEAGCPEGAIRTLSKLRKRVHVPFWDTERGLGTWCVRIDPVGFSAVFRDGALTDCHAVIRISDRTLVISGLAFKPSCPIQWHITDECDQRCKHCYLFAQDAGIACVSTPYDELIRTLDGFTEYAAAKHLYPMPVISGGDPLLHPDFWRFAEELHGRGLHWRMMGNPFHLDAAVCERLKALGCYRFQMSLDGLEAYHDAMRKPGSFRATLDAVGLLKAAGIQSQLMATVSRQNMEDVLACMDVAVRCGADVFQFARYCATSPDAAAHAYPTPEEYRFFLLRYYVKRGKFREMGCATDFPLKENLFKLLQWELGELRIPDASVGGFGRKPEGCSLGRGCAILPNGDVMACRRMQSVLGNVRTDSFADIMESDLRREYTDITHIQKCKDCALLKVCRGCRAVGYNVTGDLQGPDPMCWKEWAD